MIDVPASLNALLRQLPQVEAVLGSPLLAPALTRWRRDVVLRLVREEIEAARAELLRAQEGANPVGAASSRPSHRGGSSQSAAGRRRYSTVEGMPPRGEAIGADAVAQRVCRRLEALQGSVLRPVINGTGVLLHTNLGRAVLSPESQAAIAQIAAGYSNLEMDLASGKRTRRDVTLEPLITALTGAEAATVVNNCAAAVYLALFTLARGKEVITSRGELVEIGGSYRVPEVVKASGCKLVEVGTTNKTRIADYAAAITPKTALLLKTHTSNYRIRGFVEEASVAELAALGAQQGIPVLVDLGSGLIVPDPSRGGVQPPGPDREAAQTGGLTPPLQDGGTTAAATGGRAASGVAPTLDEPDVLSTLAAGPDLVCFSGDKLLGGPQAGIIAGKRAVIEKLRKSQMWRALRIGKLTASALGAALLSHLHGVEPQWRQRAALGSEALREEAEALCALLRQAAPQWRFELLAAEGSFGGGSLPDESLPSFAVAAEAPGLGADRLDARLRRGEPALAGYILAGRYCVNVLALLPGDASAIADAMRKAAGA